MRGANRTKSVLEALLSQCAPRRSRPALVRPARLAKGQAEISSIMSRDYRGALCRCLSRWQVREIVEEGKGVWPELNQAPVKLVSLEEFVERWSALGVDFKFAPLPWKDGLSLLGFYVKKADGARQRPLIFVNTAHHPAVVGVALDHEMGHHLTSRIFASSEEGTHLLSLTGFREHLADPVELAADTLVSFGIFPENVARSLFRRARGEVADRGLPDPVLAKLLNYVANRYGFIFDLVDGAEKKFQALAALVHYTKLRRALLEEYRI